jgi:hypothetical protein
VPYIARRGHATTHGICKAKNPKNKKNKGIRKTLYLHTV